MPGSSAGDSFLTFLWRLPRRLIDQRIAIIGLGLMGGSLALALRGKCAALLGVDSDPEICAFAIERGVIDQAALTPGELLPQASMVILATPVMTILGLIANLPSCTQERQSSWIWVRRRYKSLPHWKRCQNVSRR